VADRGVPVELEGADDYEEVRDVIFAAMEKLERVAGEKDTTKVLIRRANVDLYSVQYWTDEREAAGSFYVARPQI
jgi:hypothetical protein